MNVDYFILMGASSILGPAVIGLAVCIGITIAAILIHIVAIQRNKEGK